MKTVSMKSDSDEAMEAPYVGQTAYPYGLCLSLNEEQCEKLGISKALKPGCRARCRWIRCANR